MDSATLAELQTLRQLADTGVLDAESARRLQEDVVRGATETSRKRRDEQARMEQGLPLAPATVPGTLPSSFAGATISIGGGAPAPEHPARLQLQAAPARALLPAPVPLGTSPAQLAAQQQVAALQQQQADMVAQQDAMAAQMEAAQAKLQAAAAAPVPKPAPARAAALAECTQQVQSTSSGDKPNELQLQPLKKKSEKQSTTDQDNKAATTSSATSKRAIVVMFCDICDSTAMSEELDAEDVREVVLVYQKFCGEILNSLGGHIAQYLGDGILTYFGFVSFCCNLLLLLLRLLLLILAFDSAGERPGRRAARRGGRAGDRGRAAEAEPRADEQGPEAVQAVAHPARHAQWDGGSGRDGRRQPHRDGEL